MTEIAVREDTSALEPFIPTARETAAVVSLIEWADQARAASRLAETLCETSFVPVHFRKKPLETAAAILTGAEVGLSPMAALRSIYVIGGTPGMYARTMVALVQSKGHEVWVVEQSDDRVTVGGRRKGSEREHFTTWDRARVVKAGLQSNQKYQTTPQQMLYARASSEMCRQVAADVLLGIPYSVEELEDMPPAVAVEPRRQLTAADITGAPPAVAEQDEPTEGEVVKPPADMITDAQQRLFRVLLAKLNLAGPANREKVLTKVSLLLGRDVESSTELTKVEAGFIIDRLDAEVADLPDAEPPAEGEVA